MDPLAVNAVAPATLSALSALRRVQSVVDPAPAGPASGATGLTFQDLAQGLFQRTLQVSAVLPVAEPATPAVSLAQEATASLLASLNPPQAAATATPVAAGITAAPPAPDTTAPATTPAPALPQELPATQDTFATGTSLDFALQTALRFGAGVVTAAAPALAAPDLGTGLVRDAMAVPRMGNLQAREGGPGPEAFARPQATARQVLQSYQPPPPQGPGQVDLLI